MRRRPEYDRKLIGRNLRRLREAKGLSVDEVRNYLCLGSVQAIYKYKEDGCDFCMAPDLTAGIVEAALFHVDRMRRGDRLERYHKLYRNDKSMAAG